MDGKKMQQHQQQQRLGTINLPLHVLTVWMSHMDCAVIHFEDY